MQNAIAKLHTPEFTQKVLVVSTSHYPMHTDVALFADEDEDNDDLHETISLSALEPGWLIYISKDVKYSEGVEKNLIDLGHAELASLMRLARENGFDQLKLDPEGCILPEELGFPVFEW